MKRLKYGIAAGITMFSLGVSPVLPTWADDTQGSGFVQVGDPDDLLNTLRTSTTPLSSVTVSEANVSVALGQQKHISVSYNEGFDTANIDMQNTSVIMNANPDPYFAFSGFDGRWDDQSGSFIQESTSIYVYGNNIGSGDFTVTATDKDGNSATTVFHVTVIDALGSGSDWVDGDDGYTLIEAGARFETPIPGGRRFKVQQANLPVALSSIHENLRGVLDINVLNEQGGVIPVANNNIEMWMGINKSMLQDGECYFQIVYLDENGVIKEYFDVRDVEDDGWGWMFTTNTTHLSNYGILASTTPFESADSKNAEISQQDAGASSSTLASPDSGSLTNSEAAGASADYAIASVIAALATMLVSYGVLRDLKKDAD